MSPATITSLLGLATGDAFGCPFEYHEGAPALASRSLDERRYLQGYEDCGLPIRRCRTPGLGSDDTQQSLVLLWVWAQMTKKGIDPLQADKAAELFVKVCTRMAREPVSQKAHTFGVHRGTGKNFRDAILRGEPSDSAGLGAAMRVGPIATLLPSPEVLVPWVVEVSSTTTSSPLGQAAAAMFALRVWYASRGEKFTIDDPPKASQSVRDAWSKLRDAYHILHFKGVDALLNFAVQHGASRKLRGPADGFALTGVPWVLWCVDQGEGYADTLVRACSLGGDADTVCAMAGCAAALVHGRESIPPWMLDGLVGRAHMEDPSLWHPLATERNYVAMDIALCHHLEAEARVAFKDRK